MYKMSQSATITDDDDGRNQARRRRTQASKLLDTRNKGGVLSNVTILIITFDLMMSPKKLNHSPWSRCIDWATETALHLNVASSSMEWSGVELSYPPESQQNRSLVSSLSLCVFRTVNTYCRATRIPCYARE